MPLPRSLARSNLVATNRVTGLVAGRLPGFAIVEHVGRRSGRVRRTPVNVFCDGDDYVVALTYGRGSRWVRNVQAAGGCEVITAGRRVRLADPVIVTDPDRSLVPAPGRPVLAAIGVEDFLVLAPA